MTPMADPRIIRVFVASPGDVHREQESMRGVVNELNRTLEALLPDSGVLVRVYLWETDVAPDMGRPQEVINSQNGDYDIFIGMMWKRVGTNSGAAPSGTVEEFRIACERRRREGKPVVMFYFNTSPIDLPQSVDEVEQLQKMLEFRAEVNKTALAKPYAGASVFMDTVRPDMAKWIGVLLRDGQKTGANVPAAVPVEAVVPVPIGQQVKLTEIGPLDACYNHQSPYVGRTGVVIEGEQQKGWLRGTFRFDAPLFAGDDGVYNFLQFRVDARG